MRLIDHVPEFLAGVERDDPTGRDGDRLAGPRISALPSPLVPNREASEAGDENRITGFEGVFQQCEHTFNEFQCFRLRNAELALNFFGNIKLCHC